MTSTTARSADVILIGGGIMSATLGSMLTVLKPDLKIVMLERAGELAAESSGAWNNAGTGHSGFCELNYMPNPTDPSKAVEVADQFQTSLAWWHYLATKGMLEPSRFLHEVPHVDVVFGDADINYLRTRFQTLHGQPHFRAMQFSQDPVQISKWAPLVIDQREAEPLAATFVPQGTDIDFGELTRSLTKVITERGGTILVSHTVVGLRQTDSGEWVITARNGRESTRFRAPFIFVGAGGQSLHLLQKARMPEIRGYAVLPVGAAFFRCSRTEVVQKHNAKVYGQAPVGAPPMSVPHLDRRVVEGAKYLMFGPYATFSTKLLKNGRLTDFFKTLRWRNLHVIAAALLRETSLIRYLIVQLASTRRRKFRQLKRYYPAAQFHDWELLAAGQRAQLVKPDPEKIGVLQQGTELVVAADRSIAGLLGASPGASTAVPIMLNLVQQCFPDIEIPEGFAAE